jgi:hypothetical protein
MTRESMRDGAVSDLPISVRVTVNNSLQSCALNYSMWLCGVGHTQQPLERGYDTWRICNCAVALTLAPAM